MRDRLMLFVSRVALARACPMPRRLAADACEEAALSLGFVDWFPPDG